MNEHRRSRLEVLLAAAALVASIVWFFASGWTATAHDPGSSEHHSAEHGSEGSVANAQRAMEAIEISRTVRASSDSIPSRYLDHLEGNESTYRTELSRLLSERGNYQFWLVPSVSGELCIFGVAPRSQYIEGDDQQYSTALTCRELDQFPELGISLTMGPSAQQRGVFVVPDSVASVERGDFELPVASNVIEIGLHGDEDPIVMVNARRDGELRSLAPLPATAELTSTRQ